MLIKHSQRLDLKSAESILKAAGRDPGDGEINKVALLRGIEICHGWYNDAQFYSTNRGQSDRREYLEKVYKKAKALDVLLSKNSSWLPLGPPPSSSETYRACIKEIIANIDRELKPRGPPASADRELKPRGQPASAFHDGFKSRSPFEWLVAYYLPDVFGLLKIGSIDTVEEFSPQKGSYIRFAQAVLAELKIDIKGKPYSPESITKAFRSRFLSLPRTRKRKHQAPDRLAWWRMQLLRKEMGLLSKDDEVVDRAESGKNG
jgi:hypothetical protein